jgi:hypothetical protein
VFVGAAVRIDPGYRFVATDFRLERLDSSIWPTLADVRRVVRRVYLAETSGGLVTPRPAAIMHPARAGERIQPAAPSKPPVLSDA